MIEFKGSHFERDVILWGVRWYVAYPISYRQLEEMMEERGVEVDHSTLNRWVVNKGYLSMTNDPKHQARRYFDSRSISGASLASTGCTGCVAEKA
jgi:transposase-like protein